MSVRVEALPAEVAGTSRWRLAAILADCVAGGASISFMSPLSEPDAAAWWSGIIQEVATGHVVLLGAYVDETLVGSAQLGLDLPANQSHRADVRKVIVHRSARGKGVGAALMAGLEREARARGRTLLTLDTAGAAADRLYRRCGWTEAGTIPGYALWPDGGLCDTTFFWKRV